jgi:hypothetical protein
VARFHLDNNVSFRAAGLLRQDGHGLITARELGLEAATDAEHLLSAAQQGRILLTHDREDFRVLSHAWRLWGSAWRVALHHSGILAIPQDPVWNAVRAADGLRRFLATGLPLVNEMYACFRHDGWFGWHRLRPDDEWDPLPGVDLPS